MRKFPIQGTKIKYHHFLAVTIAAKKDYCNSIDIAGNAIAILLLLWTTIEILM